MVASLSTATSTAVLRRSSQRSALNSAISSRQRGREGPRVLPIRLQRCNSRQVARCGRMQTPNGCRWTFYAGSV